VYIGNSTSTRDFWSVSYRYKRTCDVRKQNIISDCDCPERDGVQCGMPTPEGKCTKTLLIDGDDFCPNHKCTDFRMTEYDVYLEGSVYAEHFCGSDRICCDNTYLDTLYPREIRCYQHDGGLDIGLQNRYWVYIVCPKCGYGHSWNKM
jgi:hypothetical protein